MSNSRKPRNRKLVSEEAHLQGKVSIPMIDQIVAKRVPAVIHFSQVEGTDRDDDETIGEAIIYEDGTSDVIVFSNISEEAKMVVYGIQSELEHLDMED